MKSSESKLQVIRLSEYQVRVIRTAGYQVKNPSLKNLMP